MEGVRSAGEGTGRSFGGRPPLLARWARWVLLLTLALVGAGCSNNEFSDLRSSSDSGDQADGDEADGDDQADGSGDEHATGDGEGVTFGTDDGTDTGGSDEAGTVSPYIRIDQFGYLPAGEKVAVLADPEVGHDADEDFDPGEMIEVRRWDDDEVVFSAAPTAWSGGAVHEQSGDRGWWFDFSEVSEPGSYYLFAPAADAGSGRFEIGPDVYDEVFAAAQRMFWFNRGNTDHPEELAGPWADDAAYVGAGQDTEARSVDDQDNPATALDLSGGWFDAGDTNKYVTFAQEPVHLLLTAYERQPEVFTDSIGIPESGNGIPDVVDEVRWELEWLERMQLDDGGVLTKVGVIEREPLELPSQSTLARFYEEVCSSATIAASGMYAHAALVFAEFDDLTEDADRLRSRAETAFDWYQANPKRDDCDSQVVRAGDADLSVEEQEAAEVVAAVYLLALTGDDRYNQVVVDGFDLTLAFTGAGFGNYGPNQSDALAYYRDLAQADPSVVAAIDERMAGLVASSDLYGFDPDADLYRSFMPGDSYHWGSNMVKANIGTSNLLIDSGEDGRRRAAGHLHYFHGVNPVGLVYLSNMGPFGAERSVQALFHYWFGEATAYDVYTGSEIGAAPGFLVGGPNRWYSGQEAPPAGQPPQKSYRDWSATGSEPSWEITEPAIYYQAAYVRLLAELLAGAE